MIDIEAIKEQLNWGKIGHPQSDFKKFLEAESIGAHVPALIAEVERLKAKVEKDKATMKRLTTTIQNRAESLNDQRREYRNLLRKRDDKIARLQKLQEIETFNKEAAWKDVAQKREWLDEASKLLEEARAENKRLQRVIDNVESVKHRLVQELEVGLSVGSRMIVSDLEEALEELE